MKITTSIQRVRRYGKLWCTQGDSVAKHISDTLGVGERDEIDIHDALPKLSLEIFFLAMAAPHPRYSVQAQRILNDYQARLVYLLADEITPEEGQSLLLCRNNPSRKKHQRRYWSLARQQADTPRRQAVTQCALSMVMAYDIAYCLMLATKQYLNIAAMDGKLKQEVHTIEVWLQERIKNA